MWWAINAIFQRRGGESGIRHPSNINLDTYAAGGIPLSVVLGNLKESNQDRYAFYDRNLSGDAVSTITGIVKPPAGATIKDLKGVLFYYYPPTQSSGVFYAQINRQYDSLRTSYPDFQAHQRHSGSMESKIPMVRRTK